MMMMMNDDDAWNTALYNNIKAQHSIYFYFVNLLNSLKHQITEKN